MIDVRFMWKQIKQKKSKHPALSNNAAINQKRNFSDIISTDGGIGERWDQ